jgi:hypothetical protein
MQLPHVDDEFDDGYCDDDHTILPDPTYELFDGESDHIR